VAHWLLGDIDGGWVYFIEYTFGKEKVVLLILSEVVNILGKALESPEFMFQ
jgi:hypothetical protein